MKEDDPTFSFRVIWREEKTIKPGWYPWPGPEGEPMHYEYCETKKEARERAREHNKIPSRVSVAYSLNSAGWCPLSPLE